MHFLCGRCVFFSDNRPQKRSTEMKYTEMLELYKQDGLSAEEKERLAEEIERQRAIGAYLAAEEGTGADADAKRSAREAKERKGFIKLIRSRVRRSLFVFSVFLIMIIVFLSAGTVWLLYQMPKWEDEKYYDPIGEERQQQLEKDMMYYSALFMPDKKWNELKVEERGWGNYSVTLNEFLPDEFIYGDKMEKGDAYRAVAVSGEIRKGALDIFGSDVFTRRASYPFREGAADVRNESRLKFYDRPVDKTFYLKSVERTIASINDDEIYDCYITFDKPYAFDEAIDIICRKTLGYRGSYEADSLWLAVCRKTDNIYEASTAMGVFVYDDSLRRYDSPIMNTLYDDISRVNLDTYEQNKQQYDSDRAQSLEELQSYLPKAIRYVAAQKDFLMMLGCTDIVPYKRVDAEGVLENGSPASGIAYSYEYSADIRYEHEAAYLNSFADSLEQNGIYTYGCRFGAASGKYLKELLKDTSSVGYVSLEKIG